jgi:hypothetical protein
VDSPERRELLKQMTSRAGAKLPAHRLDIPSESREPRRVPGGGASSPITDGVVISRQTDDEGRPRIDGMRRGGRGWRC